MGSINRHMCMRYASGTDMAHDVKVYRCKQFLGAIKRALFGTSEKQIVLHFQNGTPTAHPRGTE
jgi:hypothetical protein